MTVPSDRNEDKWGSTDASVARLVEWAKSGVASEWVLRAALEEIEERHGEDSDIATAALDVLAAQALAARDGDAT